MVPVFLGPHIFFIVTPVDVFINSVIGAALLDDDLAIGFPQFSVEVFKVLRADGLRSLDEFHEIPLC
jgi:hypothetical protein